MKQLASACSAAVLAAAFATSAQAQSAYGCVDLEGLHSHASVEGESGVFFPILPDLKMFHPFSDESIEDLARLRETLASLGTTLVYVPVPTKSLAMPEALPAVARDYGFDADVAASVYDENIDRLRLAEIVTANARSALRGAAGEPPGFFATDPRITSEGSRRLAQAIAAAIAETPGFADLPKSVSESRPSGIATLPSKTHAALQSLCLQPLPPVATESYVTTRVQAGAAVNDNAVFGSTMTSSGVTILGTEITGDPAVNLAGFLSEFSGLDVVQYSVEGGGAFAAMSSYLTSREFIDKRPAYLVWVNPINNNLAQYGDQPLRELIAAAGGNCRVPLTLLPSRQPNTVIADLSTLDPGQSYTLFVDADGSPAGEARFDFLSGTGLVRSKYVLRQEDQLRNGQFYMPLSGLWAEGARSVDIVLDAPFGNNTRVSACFD
jgi:alginate biosynthesis protein AlgX